MPKSFETWIPIKKKKKILEKNYWQALVIALCDFDVFCYIGY